MEGTPRGEPQVFRSPPSRETEALTLSCCVRVQRVRLDAPSGGLCSGKAGRRGLWEGALVSLPLQ